METITYILKCDICQKETGRLELPAWKWKDVELNNNILGFDTIRCDEHPIEE